MIVVSKKNWDDKIDLLFHRVLYAKAIFFIGFYLIDDMPEIFKTFEFRIRKDIDPNLNVDSGGKVFYHNKFLLSL